MVPAKRRLRAVPATSRPSANLGSTDTHCDAASSSKSGESRTEVMPVRIPLLRGELRAINLTVVENSVGGKVEKSGSFEGVSITGISEPFFASPCPDRGWLPLGVWRVICDPHTQDVSFKKSDSSKPERLSGKNIFRPLRSRNISPFGRGSDSRAIPASRVAKHCCDSRNNILAALLLYCSTLTELIISEVSDVSVMYQETRAIKSSTLLPLGVLITRETPFLATGV